MKITILNKNRKNNTGSWELSNLNSYTIDAGFTITKNHNETLDSATIVLSQVPLRDRLIGLKQTKVYRYVRVYDKNNPGVKNTNRILTAKIFMQKKQNRRSRQIDSGGNFGTFS